jgi:sucrose-phosphate synthase
MISHLISDNTPDVQSMLKPLSNPGGTRGSEGLKIMLISLHGLIRCEKMELGCDADTGGQVKYVVELAQELAAQPGVREVELLTRQVIDPKVDASYGQTEEIIGENAKIVRIPFGPKRYLKKESLWPYIGMFASHPLRVYGALFGASQTTAFACWEELTRATGETRQEI